MPYVKDYLHPMSMECHISDRVAPIVILFGYPYSGRTVALIRLAKYLKKNGYFVTLQQTPDRPITVQPSAVAGTPKNYNRPEIGRLFF